MHDDGTREATSEVDHLRPGVAGRQRNGTRGYDEATLDVDFAKAWTAEQPWTDCSAPYLVAHVPRGANGRLAWHHRTPIRWQVPTSSLEELDEALFAHAKRRFAKEVRGAALFE